MKTQFAIFNGNKLTRLTNATNAAGAVYIYVSRILRLEYDMLPNEFGKTVTKENMQSAYNDWADTMLENMQNDGYEQGEYIINMDDMISNWSNRSWVVEWNGKQYVSIGNDIQYSLIENLFNKLEVKELTVTIN
jgi:hypothetical protein